MHATWPCTTEDGTQSSWAAAGHTSQWRLDQAVLCRTSEGLRQRRRDRAASFEPRIRASGGLRRVPPLWPFLKMTTSSWLRLSPALPPQSRYLGLPAARHPGGTSVRGGRRGHAPPLPFRHDLGRAWPVRLVAIARTYTCNDLNMNPGDPQARLQCGVLLRMMHATRAQAGMNE